MLCLVLQAFQYMVFCSDPLMKYELLPINRLYACPSSWNFCVDEGSSGFCRHKNDQSIKCNINHLHFLAGDQENCKTEVQKQNICGWQEEPAILISRLLLRMHSTYVAAFYWTSTKNEWNAQKTIWSCAFGPCFLVIWSCMFWLSIM